jgi:translation elongation factor EF-G
MPTTTPVQQDSHTEGYAQVVELEKQQEDRVRDALAELTQEEQKLRSDLEDQARNAEQKAKSLANEELKEYKDKELARILQEGENQTEDGLKHIESGYKKHAPNIVKSLTETVLDPSFLS